MANPVQPVPRETAETPPRELADERTFTEAEAYAIAADRVATETASRDAEIAELKQTLASRDTEKADLQTQLDVATARAETAEQSLETYKAEQARAAEIASQRTERRDKVREARSDLKDEFFSDERVNRWAEMAQADFDALLTTLVETAPAAATGTPAEIAAAHSHVEGEQVKPTSPKGFYELLKGGK